MPKIKQKNLCEINGVLYMSPSSAGDLWNMKYQAVSQACKAGRVVGACLDSGNKWIIPTKAIKPLDMETIRQVLISTLALKNKPSSVSTLSLEDAKKVYGYLMDTGFVERCDNITLETLKNLILTEKGMQTATSGKISDIDWVNAVTTLIQVVASVMTIWQAIKTI